MDMVDQWLEEVFRTCPKDTEMVRSWANGWSIFGGFDFRG